MTTNVTQKLSTPVSILTILNTSIGKKLLMAITGLIWIGFLVMHMYGNLKIFYGAEYFNHYAEGLRELGSPVFGRLHLLTIMRTVMTVALISHVWLQFVLGRQNDASRNVGYAVHRKVQANRAALTMRYGGVAIFLFVLYHLAHFTWGIPAIHAAFTRGDAYGNLVYGFQSPINVAIYLVALAALGMHLYHGTWSAFQTLGINNSQYTRPLRLLALAVAVLLPLGFAVAPISVIAGFVR